MCLLGCLETLPLTPAWNDASGATATTQTSLWEGQQPLIERPLTAAQARGQRLASQELLENIEEILGEETVEDEAAGPEPPLAEPLESLQTS